jgi:hypothetical protein
VVGNAVGPPAKDAGLEYKIMLVPERFCEDEIDAHAAVAFPCAVYHGEVLFCKTYVLPLATHMPAVNGVE